MDHQRTSRGLSKSDGSEKQSKDLKISTDNLLTRATSQVQELTIKSSSNSIIPNNESSKTPKSNEEVPQILSSARTALDFHMKQVEMEIDSDILSAYENEALSIMLSPKSQKSSRDKSPEKQFNKSPKGLRKSQLTPSKQEPTIRITRSISSSQGGKGKVDPSPAKTGASKRALSPSRESEIIELRGNKVDISEMPEDIGLYSAARLWIRDNRDYDSDEETTPFELQLPPPESLDAKSKQQQSEHRNFQTEDFEKSVSSDKEIPHSDLLEKMISNSRAVRENCRKEFHTRIRRYTKRLKKVFDSNTNQMTPADEMLTRYIVNVKQNNTNNGV